MAVHRAGFALPLDELRDEFDRLWNTLVTAPPLHGWHARPGQGTFPACNVRETDEAITVEAELPGLDAGAVEVSVSGEELLLKGSRPGHSAAASDCGVGETCQDAGREPREKAKEVWHLRERGAGAFERRLPLPVPVDASRVEARLVDGVLTVVCPKLAECQPRRVQVRGS